VDCRNGGAVPRNGELGRSRSSWDVLDPPRRLADEALPIPPVSDGPIPIPLVWPNMASGMIAGWIAAASKTAKMTPAHGPHAGSPERDQAL
jgi:hypothetical protein